MLSPEELLEVARAYRMATGYSMVTIGRRSCNNDKIYKRIAIGGGALTGTIVRATDWFALNWPANAFWPEGVARPANMIRRPRPDSIPECAA
jgi:hypothetical protein